jgi:glycosyltransferase involved in cell wall biosynthesis
MTASQTAPGPRVAVVIPAKDEAARIGATVEAVRDITGVDLVVVVDDGSADDTAAIAREAGAAVVTHSRNRGKAAAMATGAAYVARHEVAEPAASTRGASRSRPLLFVDADLQASAANVGVLVPPVLQGRADMTIATLPPQRAPGGGRGLVVRLARSGIEDLTGFRAVQPLSGMRCMSRRALDAATPLARGWGAEVGLTVDVLSAGMVVEEVPCELHHRVTGTDWRGQLHRARQYRDVALALLDRRLRRRVSPFGSPWRRSGS